MTEDDIEQIDDDVYLVTTDIDIDSEEGFQTFMNVFLKAMEGICGDAFDDEVVVQVPESIKTQIVNWALNENELCS